MVIFHELNIFNVQFLKHFVILNGSVFDIPSSFTIHDNTDVRPDDPDYADCGGTCQHVSIPCNDTCTLTTWRCGGECVDLANTTVTDCAGTCQSVTLPCNSSCPLGYTMCNDTCHLDTGDTWSCDSMCISTHDTCQSRCHPGWLRSETGICQEQCCHESVKPYPFFS